MPDSRTLIFESYQLDLRREQLRRGEDAIPLTNKAFAVLCYLVEHAEQLITRDALLEAVWPDTFVSDAALTVCIHELRQALREKAQTPRLIETVRGRGYRFLAPVTVSVPAPTRHEALPPSSLQLAFSHPQSVGLVGREAELLQLHQGLVTALQGERQVIFITGEAGIGKTTLVEAFLAQIARDQTVWIGYGQCIDQYGAGEAYLPLLEALGRLCRGPDGQALMELLRQEAPSWLLQMAALLSFDEFDALQRRGGGATRERMLRELAEALERLTVDRPFVLVLEDLHWSDSATLEWLAYVARRRDPARLLVLCTYRPVEAIVQAHPLRTVTQELRRLGQCAELMLDYLPESGVAAYIVQRCGDTCLPTSLIQRLHHRTNGNPLFMVTVVDGVARHLDPSDPAWQEDIEAALVKIPETLRQLIEHQLSQIDPDDQVLLETASVVGITFTAAAIAAALGTDEIDVENRCEALSRRELFMQSQGIMEWPDGTVTTRYGFSHALHQEVLYDRVAAGRRVRLHRHIGTRQETGYGTQAREIAAELALHFTQGKDTQRAVQYLLYAGENALRRSAYQEAITHLTEGLDWLATFPDIPVRPQQELDMRVALGQALAVTKGYAAPEVTHTYALARALCQQVWETPQLFRTLRGLWAFYLVRAEWQTAQELGEQLLSLAQRTQDLDLLLVAHDVMEDVLLWLGEFAPAKAHADQAHDLYDPQRHHPQVFLYGGYDPGVGCLASAALILWYLGYPDQALRSLHEGLALAQELSHPFSLSWALLQAAQFYNFRREAHVVEKRAEAAIALSTEQGFPLWVTTGTILRGWALAAQGRGEEGVTQIRQGLAARQATGIGVGQARYLALLAEAYGHVWQPETGLAILVEALAAAARTGEREYEAELYRLKGELMLKGAVPDKSQAELCFYQALDVARQQQAKSLELRAVTSLARLWQQQDKRQEAHALLAPVYGWFIEGFDTADLQEARALLDELQRSNTS